MDLETLRQRGSRIEVITPDADSRIAMGPNQMDPAPAGAAPTCGPVASGAPRARADSKAGPTSVEGAPSYSPKPRLGVCTIPANGWVDAEATAGAAALPDSNDQSRRRREMDASGLLLRAVRVA